MYGKPHPVKALALIAFGLLLTGLAGAGETALQPHMMYFYNPSCRLCTRTNEVVGEAEGKYEGVMSHQRFNIADTETGTDNVLYMFDLMDELEVPEEGNVTLIVFLGLLEEREGEWVFIPKRALVEGEEIIPKLDAEIRAFLDSVGKGGIAAAPAGFFRPSGVIASHTAYAATPPVDTGGSDVSIIRPPGYVPAQSVAPAPAPAAPVPASGGPDVSGLRPGAGAPPSRPGTVSGSSPATDHVKPGSSAAPSAAAPAVRPRARSGEGAGSGASARAQSQLQFGAITGAALADSVNPCAFATIIILVAMMSSAKRSKREIVAVCLAFTASVFLTYFAIGLFLYKVIAAINEQGGWFLVAADIIYYIAFAICVVCAVLSLRDAYLLFSGRSAEEMALKLPKAFKNRINVAMAKGVRASWLVAGVFMAGVTVSFLEAACTGQVYLPTIISLAKIGFWHSMALLAWYNFLFVLPLLIIFGLVLLGVTSQQLADFFKKNVAWTKLALGLVFVVMGVVIWFEMYWPPGYRG